MVFRLISESSTWRRPAASSAASKPARAGRPPRPGFLLGTRRYLASRPWFAEAEWLAITADLVYCDAEVGVFDCRIRSGSTTVATAQLIVTEPRDVTGLLGRQGGTDDG